MTANATLPNPTRPPRWPALRLVLLGAQVCACVMLPFLLTLRLVELALPAPSPPAPTPPPAIIVERVDLGEYARLRRLDARLFRFRGALVDAWVEVECEGRVAVTRPFFMKGERLTARRGFVVSSGLEATEDCFFRTALSGEASVEGWFLLERLRETGTEGRHWELLMRARAQIGTQTIAVELKESLSLTEPEGGTGGEFGFGSEVKVGESVTLSADKDKCLFSQTMSRFGQDTSETIRLFCRPVVP